MYVVLSAAVLPTVAEIEIRKELRTDGLLFYDDIIILPIQRTLFHRDTLAATDTEAFAMTPLSTISDGGLSLAQTSSSTVAGTSTGFFDVDLPFIWLEDYPGEPIGGGLSWVANAQPIRFAGIPTDTMMVFPEMTMITRPPDDRGNVSRYIIDANNSIPRYPGNMMLIKNMTDENGKDVVTLERPPREYMTLFASPEEVANKTIIERMWRNVHINYNLDRAYVGETCFPDLIYPVKETYTLMPFVPDETSIRDSLNRTKPGSHLVRIFWPVGD